MSAVQQLMAAQAAAAGGSSWTLTSVATDNFNRASLGSDWAQLLGFTSGGDVAIQSSTYVSGTSNNTDTTDVCAARRITETFSNDQYAEIAILGGIGNNGGNYRLGVIVRASADTEGARDFYGLEVLMDGTGNPANRTWKIFKTVNGTKTTITSGSVSCGTGTKIALAVKGDKLRAYKDRVQVLTEQTDTALTTGKPGMLFSGGSTDPTGDTWESGDVT